MHGDSGTMTIQTVARRRWPRGAHPKRSDSSAQIRKLPEYLEAHEVEAIIRVAGNARTKPLMLKQWTAGLRPESGADKCGES